MHGWLEGPGIGIMLVPGSFFFEGVAIDSGVMPVRQFPDSFLKIADTDGKLRDGGPMY